jgi:hypothetical protein
VAKQVLWNDRLDYFEGGRGSGERVSAGMGINSGAGQS